MVVACFAAITGCMVGTWQVANTAGFLVDAPMAAAQVKHSKPSPLKLVLPPKPFQRPTGTMASNSISSASFASAAVLSQLTFSTPSIDDIVAPPERFEQKVPSFSLRSLNSGLLDSRNSPARSRTSMTPPLHVFCYAVGLAGRSLSVPVNGHR